MKAASIGSFVEGLCRWEKLRYWLVLASFGFFFSCHSFTSEDINHPEKVDSLLSRAGSVIRFQSLDRGRRFLDSAYSRFPDAGIMDRYRNFYFLADHYNFHDYEADKHKVDLYTDSLFALFDREEIKTRYPKEYAFIHLKRGDRLQFEKMYDEAYQYYFQGKLLIEPTDKCQMNQFTSRIAGMNYEQKNFARAAHFYKQAYREVMQCEDPSDFDAQFINRQGYLSNVALCYTALEMPDSALHYFEQALRFIRENEHKFPGQKDFIAMARGVIYGNQGAAYLKKREYKRAIPLLLENVRINSQKGYYNRDAQFAQAKLSEVYLEDNQLDKAYQALQVLDKSLDTLPNNTAKLRGYEVQWKYWEKRNRIDKSQQILKKYITLKDIVVNDRRTFDGLDLALQKMDSEHKLELVQKKEELNRLYMLVAITVSIMALIIALLIWTGWNRARKNVAELASLNQRLTDRNTRLQDTLTALEQSQQENNRLLKVVAHDLRTPVSSIMMAADLLLDGQPTTRRPRFFLEMIKTSADSSLNLINNLLQSNSVPDKKEEINLEEFLTSGVDMLRLKAFAKCQTIDLKTDAIPVWMDRQKMWRVIGNLLTNAIKFSPAQSTIAVRTQKRDQTVLISIQDQGIGIPDRLKDKVFDLFTEASREGTSGEKTFGLGLAISRQIVEAHGGKLWFDSQENRGTTFFIELPL